MTGQFDSQLAEVGHFTIGISRQNCRTTAPVEIRLTSGEFQPGDRRDHFGQIHAAEIREVLFDTEIINFSGAREARPTRRAHGLRSDERLSAAKRAPQLPQPRRSPMVPTRPL